MDLAGSEQVGKQNMDHARSIEGSNINKSLLALSNCIVKLADRS